MDCQTAQEILQAALNGEPPESNESYDEARWHLASCSEPCHEPLKQQISDRNMS